MSRSFWAKPASSANAPRRSAGSRTSTRASAPRAPCLAFAGHTDVVPPGDAARWRFDPFGGEVAEGKLWGRGAADMKGGVAASLAAALRFVASGPFGGSIAFLLTGDEEGPAVDGTVRLVELLRERGERIDHCVLGEPTSVAALGDTIKNGRRGSLTGRLRLLGKQGHVAYPHLADNPARALPRALDALFAPPLDEGTPDFQPSNLEVVQRRRRQSRDQRDSRRNPASSSTSASTTAGRRRRWRRKSAAASPPPARKHELTFDPTNAVAFLTPRGPFTDLVSDAVEEVTGRRPELSTGGGTSDARFIKDLCPVVELGLLSGNMHGRRRTRRARRSRSAFADLRAHPAAAISRDNRPASDKARRAAPPARSGAGRRPRSAARKSAALHLPEPTSTSEPTIERTCRCRNERAPTSKWIASPSASTRK